MQQAPRSRAAERELLTPLGKGKRHQQRERAELSEPQGQGSPREAESTESGEAQEATDGAAIISRSPEEAGRRPGELLGARSEAGQRSGPYGSRPAALSRSSRTMCRG